VRGRGQRKRGIERANEWEKSGVKEIVSGRKKDEL
jgi:hypothetical protein